MDQQPRPRRLSAHPPSHALLVVALLGGLSLTWVVVAQPPATPPSDSPAPAPNKAPASSLDQLVVEQSKIADKYARLEQLLIRMAELEATSNPQRAALLKRAAQQSSDRLTRQQLGTLLKLLTPPAQLKRAVDGQQQVVTDLKNLLELLQSENRADRLKSEQARLKEYLKEVERLIRLQQGVQGRTEGGDDAKKLSQDQAQLAERTGELAKRVRAAEETDKGSSDQKGQPSSPDKSDQPNSKTPNPDGQKSPESPPKNDKPSDKQDPGKSPEKSADQPGKESGKDAGKESGKDSKKDTGKQNSGKQGEGKSGEPMPDSGQESPGGAEESPPENPEQSPENPVRKRLDAAEQRMRDAQKKLDESKRTDATDDQQKAKEELEKARQELEQILRQMREEEMERTLAMLEGRFRRMLEAELKVYESTKRLDKIPAAERTREVDIQAGKLGFEQSKITVDADKALTLLREEGSSVAFPETVEMMRDDMQQVADRLSAAQVDRLTQGIEEEIIATLEELVAAMQKAQQDLKDKKPPAGQPPGGGEPGDRPLVDSLSELKMIRALQLRVNTRTQRYSKLLENVDDPVGRANDAELRASLIKLAELEQKVLEITRNVVLGKNR